MLSINPNDMVLVTWSLWLFAAFVLHTFLRIWETVCRIYGLDLLPWELDSDDGDLPSFGPEDILSDSVFFRLRNTYDIYGTFPGTTATAPHAMADIEQGVVEREQADLNEAILRSSGWL